MNKNFNGAQTNYYQLYYADPEFAEELNKSFSLPTYDENAIYNLDPTKLEAFAKEYYADKADNIHQLISLDDPLYAVSGTRGFLRWVRWSILILIQIILVCAESLMIFRITSYRIFKH